MIGVLSVSHFLRQTSKHKRQLLTFYTGAFVAAPVGGLLWAAGAFALRVGFQWIQAKRKGTHFDAFDRPPPSSPVLYTGRHGSTRQQASSEGGSPENETTTTALDVTPQKGKFF